MSIKVKIYNKNGSFDSEIYIQNKKSLLDEMLDQGIDIYFGCMGGSCSACKCKVLKGKEFIDKEAISKQVYKDVKEDEFLSCISKIKESSEKIELEIQKCL